MAMKAGQFDYYIGACNTGGGGALAMAMALLGAGACKTISMPGKILSDEEIIQAVNEGKTAFWFYFSTYGTGFTSLVESYYKKRIAKIYLINERG